MMRRREDREPDGSGPARVLTGSRYHPARFFLSLCLKARRKPSMAPRAKRPRSDSNSAEESVESAASATTVPDANSSLKPHEKLWFEDGSIVLATDVHLYCVHKSFLANNSKVFKDMLELPNIGGGELGKGAANVDQWAGMPLVKMVGDSDENVFHLLMALYNRE